MVDGEQGLGKASESITSSLVPQVDYGGEKFSWNKPIFLAALMIPSVLAGVYLTQEGSQFLMDAANIPLSDYAKHVFSSEISTFGFVPGFLGSLRLAGRF